MIKALLSFVPIWIVYGEAAVRLWSAELSNIDCPETVINAGAQLVEMSLITYVQIVKHASGWKLTTGGAKVMLPPDS